MTKTKDIVPLMIFQWIKGDKEGNTEIIKDVEIMGEFVWVNFEGGGRINGHVINEMMILIGVAKEEDVQKHTVSKEINESIPDEQIQNVTQTTQQKISKTKNDFGFDILDKASRDSKMKINLLIDFEFISKEKIKMLLELYGDDLFESLKSYVRQQLSEEVIESCIEVYLTQEYKTELNNTIQR